VRRLYAAYGRLVFSVVYRVLCDHGLAEEATQEAFLRIWRTRDRIDVSRDVRPLLCTIARRIALDIADRERRWPTASLEDGVPAPDRSVEAAERAWTTWRVRAALEELPEVEREVARLQHLVGLTHEQIAVRVGVAVGTVKSRSFRAHRRLASLLRDLAPEAS
jgi:RNA polymerase sigma-70 factor (ECF subfamily)